MEKRFRVFLAAVIVLAVCGLVFLGIFTFSRLRDSGVRMDREDRRAFASLTERLASAENIVGVQIQVNSTMGDYERYKGFDKSLLAGLEFVHHEYLYGGAGLPGTDMTITVTLYRDRHALWVEKILTLWDKVFGTAFSVSTEKVTLCRDGDVFRVTCGETMFTASCPAMAEWLDARGGME
ncbi:MAG: hypothetical protein IKY52_01980 [Clostridia bacterium]|nr:hypothetical protein [Clostridia bacterium]